MSTRNSQASPDWKAGIRDEKETMKDERGAINRKQLSFIPRLAFLVHRFISSRIPALADFSS
jgi:hypothetical protein